MRINNKGFTLVELLVMLGIIVVIAAIAIPITVGVLNNANETEQVEWISELQAAVEEYKAVDVENTNSYPRLYREDKDGFNESKAFLTNAGNNNIPGYSVSLYNSDNSIKGAETVYSEIRRDFMLATKAFTDIDVKDDYYLTDNAKSSEYAFVYYYLTGEIKRQKYDELKYYHYNEGIVNTEEYWVFLTLPEKFQAGYETETGSGFAGLIGDSDDDGDPDVPITPGEDIDNEYLNFYVKVVDFATDKPIMIDKDEKIIVRLIGEETRRAEVGTSGMVMFQRVKAGTYTVEVKSDKNNWLAYPDEKIYVDESEKDGLVVIKRGLKSDGSLTRYIGDYIQNPYVVRLKRGTLGSMEFTQLISNWNGTEWNSQRETVIDGTVMTVDFEADITTSAISQKYIFDTKNKTLNLLTDTQFLTLGKYDMKIVSSENIFDMINKKIVAELWGIDDIPVGKYDEEAPYVYIVDLKRNKNNFSGKLRNIELEQVLQGVPDESKYLGYWDDNNTKVTPSITTKLKLKQAGIVKYETIVDKDGNFEIEGISDGLYDIELSNEYNNSFVPKDFPKQINCQGGLYIANGTIKEEDYIRTSLTVNTLFKDNNDPIQNAKVTLQRFGETAKNTQVVNTNGQIIFSNIKTGYYQISYTVPYNNTTYYIKVFVGVDGKVLTLYPTLLESKLTFRVQDEYGITNYLVNGNVRLVLTNIETNTKYPVKTLKVPTNGIVTFTARVGTYKLEILADNHYVTKTVWSNSFKVFDSTKNNLVQFVKNYGTKTIKFNISSETPHNGKVVYKKGSSSMTASGDFVSDVKHERYCTVCGYHWTPSNCIFDKTIAANVSSIADTKGNTHHRVKCKTCLINIEDQVHVFEGAYRNVTSHTQIDNGTHNRKCLYCTDYGYNGGRGKVTNCSNTIEIGKTTHTYRCNECGTTTGGWSTYEHNYTINSSLPNNGYAQVVQKTSATTGTHNLPCIGCNSRGWGKTKDATSNCQNKETKSATTHKHECTICGNQIAENHNFNGAYRNVVAHTQKNNGTHYRLCVNCSGYGIGNTLNFTESCGNDTTKQTETHTYTCPSCKSSKVYNHNFNGVYVNKVPHTTSTNGTHSRVCAGCDADGIGTTMGKTEACSNNTTISETMHTYTCSKCKSSKALNHSYTADIKVKNVYSDIGVGGKHDAACTGCSSRGWSNKKGASEACSVVIQSLNDTKHCSKCTVCNNYLEKAHTKERVKTVDGTCIKPIKYNEHCTLAGCTYSKEVDGEVDLTKHVTPNATNKITTAATCTKAGVTTFYCSTCNNATSTLAAPDALGHSYGEWVVVIEATMEAVGKEERTCTRTGCTAKEEREIPKLAMWPTSLGWHIAEPIRYSTDEETGKVHEIKDGITTKDNGLKAHFYAIETVFDSRYDEDDGTYWTPSFGHAMYDWESDVFSVKDATMHIESNSSSKEVGGGYIDGSDSWLRIEIYSIDSNGNETLYDSIDPRGFNHDYIHRNSNENDSRSYSVIVLRDGKYKIKVSSKQSVAQAAVSISFGKTLVNNVNTVPYFVDSSTGKNRCYNSFTINTPTILTFKPHPVTWSPPVPSGVPSPGTKATDIILYKLEADYKPMFTTATDYSDGSSFFRYNGDKITLALEPGTYRFATEESPREACIGYAEGAWVEFVKETHPSTSFTVTGNYRVECESWTSWGESYYLMLH